VTTATAHRVIGVRLRRADSIAYYDPGNLEVAVGDAVVVDTPLGPDLGTMAIAPCALVHRDPLVPVRPTLRLATDDCTMANAKRSRCARPRRSCWPRARPATLTCA
jgi:cell fate regulator YaaT (PSP1 superfamily)